MVKKKTITKRSSALNFREKKQVRKMAKNAVINLGEKNYHDVITTSQDGSYDNAFVSVLNKVAQSTTDTSRIGDSYRMTSLEVRANISWANSASAIGRLIIALMKPGDRDLGSAATTTYGLDDLLSNGASSGATYDMYSNDLRSRFQILYDRTFCCSQDGQSANVNSRVHLHKMIPLKKKLVQLEASTTRIIKNGIYLFWFSNATDASANEPKLSVHTRLRFIDI